MKFNFIAILLLCFGFIYAQEQYNYIVDNLHGDSAYVYVKATDAKENAQNSGAKANAKSNSKSNKKTKANNSTNETFVKKSFSVANGTLVTIDKKDATLRTLAEKINPKKSRNMSLATVNIDGKKYFIESSALMFGENPEGVEDFINKETNLHTPQHRFFYSTTPIIAVVIMLILFVVFANLIESKIFLILAPIMLLGAVGLEVGGLYLLGTDILWWLDTENEGLMMLMLRLIAFLGAVMAQAGGMYIFKNKLDESSNGKVVIWRPIAATLLAAGAIVATFFIVGTTGGGDTGFYIGFGISILIFLGGLVSTAIHNSQVLGLLPGIIFSIFAIIWCFALAACIVLFIIGFVKVLWEIITSIFIVLFVMFIISKLHLDSPSPVFIFRDKVGGQHTSAGAAEDANKRIDEILRGD